MTANPDAASRILEILKEHPEGLNILQIAEKSGLNRMSVAKYLEVMTALESVAGRPHGRSRIYFIPRKVPVAMFMEQTLKHYAVMDSGMRIVQTSEQIRGKMQTHPWAMKGAFLPDLLGNRIVNFGECLAAINKALAGEAVTVIVEDVHQGRHEFIEIYHIPIRFPDGSAGVMAISEQITNKKHTEIRLRREVERFRGIVEGVPHIVFTADPAGLLTYVSPRAEEYGLDPGMLAGRPLHELAIPEDRGRVTGEFAAVAASPDYCTIRFRLAAADRPVPVEADCMVLRDSTGTGTGISGVLRDIARNLGTDLTPGTTGTD